MASNKKTQAAIDAIAKAMGLPSTSLATNAALNKAAKQGELDAITKREGV